jgi:hypothetical protein
MGFWSAKRTMKDNQKQAVPYAAFGTIKQAQKVKQDKEGQAE